ncbi:hypothetical protein OG455_33590 [Kitasatospora sp. NBC_01287]|uniref:hypothetical protein n=1 Tax=Kitasatospora sp. NBC_01287 TaxID=2903573 RepID=UPI002255B12B|nr:hypothetical protein [Kitasatospora sp. NBC_01287]MCX4750388.1 hypothetical protein [Kitasatospora sp. NBC_01287]
MRYEFRVVGIVSETLAEAFPEFDRSPVPDQTVFFGPVTDEAQLDGVLLRFQSLGLRVLELRQLPD